MCARAAPESRATSIADGLDLGFALIHKERARPNEVSRMVLVGDVAGKVAIIVDDMADTCGTLVKAASVVREHGAVEAIAIVTHGILSGNAIEALNASQLRRIVVTNTIPCEDKMARCDRIALIDVSPTVSLSVDPPRSFLHSPDAWVVTARGCRGREPGLPPACVVSVAADWLG